MLKTGNPPAFPIGLIVPPPRGAMITAVPWPKIAAQESGVSEKPVTRKAAGAAQSRLAKPRRDTPAAKQARKSKSRKAASSNMRKPQIAPTPPVTTGQSLAKDAPVPMLTEDLLDRALAMKPVALEEAPPPTARPSVQAAPQTPLPRSRAVTTSRGQGLFDIIGHWLRDAGNWLIRLDKGRRKDEDRVRLARAKAKQHALQSQYDALEALREVAKAD